MKIIEVILDPVAQDPDNEYEKLRWTCAGCGHGNINELSKRKIENWKENGESQFFTLDCKWCRRTNFLTVGFNQSSEVNKH